MFLTCSYLFWKCSENVFKMFLTCSKILFFGFCNFRVELYFRKMTLLDLHFSEGIRPAHVCSEASLERALDWTLGATRVPSCFRVWKFPTCFAIWNFDACWCLGSFTSLQFPGYVWQCISQVCIKYIGTNLTMKKTHFPEFPPPHLDQFTFRYMAGGLSLLRTYTRKTRQEQEINFWNFGIANLYYMFKDD